MMGAGMRIVDVQNVLLPIFEGYLENIVATNQV